MAENLVKLDRPIIRPGQPVNNRIFFGDADSDDVPPPPPPIEVIEANTELLPETPVAVFPVAPAPPAPTVTV